MAREKGVSEVLVSFLNDSGYLKHLINKNNIKFFLFFQTGDKRYFFIFIIFFSAYLSPILGFSFHLLTGLAI